MKKLFVKNLQQSCKINNSVRYNYASRNSVKNHKNALKNSVLNP